MTSEILTATPEERVSEVRKRMLEHGIHALPIVDSEGHAIGIVTSTDLLSRPDENGQVLEIASLEVRVVPAYSAVAVAARMMRKERIHHLVVTNEKKVVGVLSSYDLLRLVEDRAFVDKNPAPTKKARRYVREGGRWQANPATGTDRRAKSRGRKES